MPADRTHHAVEPEATRHRAHRFPACIGALSLGGDAFPGVYCGAHIRSGTWRLGIGTNEPAGGGTGGPIFGGEAWSPPQRPSPGTPMNLSFPYIGGTSWR